MSISRFTASRFVTPPFAQPLGKSNVAALPAIAFLQTVESITNETAHTFSAFNFGADAASRRIFIFAVWQGTANTLTSITIGGVTATVHVTTTSGGANCALVSALVPSGTSGDVVVTVGATSNRFGIAGWNVTNLTNASPTSTDSSAGATSDTLTVDAASACIVIAGALSGSGSPGDITISNVTERFDVTYETIHRYVAGDANPSVADATYDMAVVWTTSTDEVAAALSWR